MDDFSSSDPGPDPFQLPNYLSAADNHNIANGNISWTNPQTLVDKLGNVGKFVATSVVAGANGFYNTGVSIGRFFGAEIEDQDTGTLISSLDDDLGKYYQQNQESVELGGFVLGSLVPGLVGVKALRAGQAALGSARIFNSGQVAFKTALTEGRVGSNIGKATGLLVDRTDAFLSTAAGQINSSTTAIKLLNANTTKALASGFWQNTLESAAFETAVQAAFFRSPILEQQDFSDIVTNVLVGGAFGGVIGGAFGAAKLRGTLKKAVRAEDIARNPFQQRFIPLDKTPTAEGIIAVAGDIESAAVPVPIRNAEGVIVNNFEATKIVFDNKVTSAWGTFREGVRKLANDDELGNILASSFQPILKEGVPVPGFSQKILEAFSGTVRIARPLETTAPEIAQAKALLRGEAVETKVAARWVKLFGEDAGQGFAEAPVLPHIGDLISGKGAILDSVRAEKFAAPKLGTIPWSMLSVNGKNAALTVEKRFIWAQHVLKEIPDGAVISQSDIPLLERAYADGKTGIRVVSDDGLENIEITSKQQLLEVMKTAKLDTANKLREKLAKAKEGQIPLKLSDIAIPRMVNVRRSLFDVGPSANELDDFLAAQGDLPAYKASLAARGLSTNTPEVIDPVFLPKYAKFVYEVDKNLVETTPHILDAMAHFAEQHKIYQQGAKNVAARVLGPIGLQIPDITAKDILDLSRIDTGAGFFTSDASRLGSIESKVSTLGALTKEAQLAARKHVDDTLGPALIKAGGSQEVAFEFEAINQRTSRSGQLWITLRDGDDTFLVTKRAEKLFTDPDTGEFDFDALFSTKGLEEDLIQIRHPDTVTLVNAHIEESGRRTTFNGEIRGQQGKLDNRDPRVFRPIRPDPRVYQHFAFVVDDTVTGAGHKTMIFAASEKELQQLIDKVPPRYTVQLKSDTENFFKFRGEYDFARTLNENYIDSDLANAGVFSNFFPKSEPRKIVDDILQQHYRENDVLVREAVRLSNESAFNALEDIGLQFSRVETSKFASRADVIENASKNPFFNLIKTALNISKTNENHLFSSFNKSLDTAVSKVIAAIRTDFAGVKTPEQLEVINAALDKHGLKPAYYDAALQVFANHTAPRGELTKFVRQGNALLSQFVLGLDPLNALVNAIGSNILRGTETKVLTDAIKSGNTELAGDLAKLMKVTTPGAPGEIFAPAKLQANAIAAFWKDRGGAITKGSGPLMTKYREMGLVKDRLEQLSLLADDLTLTGTESVTDLNKRINTAFERSKNLAGAALAKGEKLSGNKLAEEFNRFVSANVMDQITSLAIKHGLMDDATARTYIRTFVNRVEGNIVASQRPAVFQGPIGQAISLFQSYQFNLMQQLFRHVGEGRAKDVAMLAGLQSTFFGLQSLPAFQFINTHIVGQLSGNSNHRDLYDATYGVAGRTAGDWLLYGIPSNILQTNVFSRGDINPRQLTILPTSLQDTPIVQGWSKFLGSIYETTQKIAGGAAVWESLLQGIEHNGVSRPLAGLAQVAQAIGPEGKTYSTTRQGSILQSNDLFTLATLSRLAGGKPLDEAITNDTLYRVKSYQAARREDLASLAEQVKSTLIQGNQPSEDQVMNFASRHAELGGKQREFNKWMMSLYKSANVSQADQLKASLNNPFAYKMQLLMGGEN